MNWIVIVSLIAVVLMGADLLRRKEQLEAEDFPVNLLIAAAAFGTIVGMLILALG